jgi:hypothetical protein
LFLNANIWVTGWLRHLIFFQSSPFILRNFKDKFKINPLTTPQTRDHYLSSGQIFGDVVVNEGMEGK